MFKDKLMTTLGEFLGLVDVDGERLDTKDDHDHDEDHIKKDDENYFNENSSSLFCA